VSETSKPATKAAAAVLRRFTVRSLRGEHRPADRAGLARVIDRATDLPELLDENQRLHEIKRGAFEAAEELREQNEQLREIAARAERWIFEVVRSNPGSRVEQLDLARGRRLISALSRARGALKGIRTRRRRSRDVPHQFPGN